jgi:chromosome segregation ATPase
VADPLAKLESAVKKLAADMGDVRREIGDLRGEMKDMRGELNDVHGELSELKKGVDQIQRTQVALTDAMTRAIKELGVGKSLEVRVSRLESAVFGTKH